ncbi:MAG: deoxyribodipyrimidine photo-lyase [Desulfovibrio sp.]|nr:MAG: deoxyribodipyrimidine photo-lyase [Desulfovibrio sp.]
MHPQRGLCLQQGPSQPGPDSPVVYWLHREHRALDNWGLYAAQQAALGSGAPLAVVYCLAPAYLGAIWRQFSFLLKGLEHVAQDLAKLRIPLFLLQGEPGRTVADFAGSLAAARVYTDFDPLRIKGQWLNDLLATYQGSVFDVDSRNIVPCRAASNKHEYAARTLRPKLRKLVPEFLAPCPGPLVHEPGWPLPAPEIDWSGIAASLDVDRSVGEIPEIIPGEEAAQAVLDTFLSQRLPVYADKRNDPNSGVQSQLSPYLHFGMIASSRVALAVLDRAPSGDVNAESFLEELIVRRELADNYCLHNPDYDSVEGFPDWAKKTLDKHRADPRPYCYSREQWEAARTHDPLWNAAQTEMRETGRMHGYMRMYWAKKILEWSESPEQAMATAIHLNDRYLLDGRDSNGYTGIAWSLGGVHDRPWKERPIFGTVRYMNESGCRRKFNVQAYIDRMLTLTQGHK